MPSATRTLAHLLLLSSASALYEEPPGGCQGPVDDDPFAAAQPRRRVVRPPPPPPPPPPQPTAEDLERELYERESAAQLSGLGGEAEEDWEAVERAHLRNQRMRLALQGVAVFGIEPLFRAVPRLPLTVCF